MASCFNPRPRAGGDREPPYPFIVRHVSIHAPARGATRPEFEVFTVDCFNPRPRAGGDELDMIEVVKSV